MIDAVRCRCISEQDPPLYGGSAMDGRNFKSHLDMTASPAGAPGTASCKPDWCRRLMSSFKQPLDKPGMLQAEHHEGRI